MSASAMNECFESYGHDNNLGPVMDVGTAARKGNAIAKVSMDVGDWGIILYLSAGETRRLRDQLSQLLSEAVTPND